MPKSSLPVEKGTLDLLVLRALSWGPMHGVEIIGWLERQTRGELTLDDSGVYQALYRMEQRGQLAAEWGMTPNNRRARYYRATPAGLTYLRAATRKFIRYSAMVTSVLTDPPLEATS